MADVVLFAIAGSLSTWLPRRMMTVQHQQQQQDGTNTISAKSTPTTINSSNVRTVKIALGLGFGLVGLSIVESIPSQYMLLLVQSDADVSHGNNNDIETPRHSSYDSDTNLLLPTLTIKTAYQIILWSLCIWISIIIPIQVALGSTDEIVKQGVYSTKSFSSASLNTSCSTTANHNNNNTNRIRKVSSAPVHHYSTNDDLESNNNNMKHHNEYKSKNSDNYEGLEDEETSKKKRLFLFPWWVRRLLRIFSKIGYALLVVPLVKKIKSSKLLRLSPSLIIILSMVCRIWNTLIIEPISNLIIVLTKLKISTSTKNNHHLYPHYSNRLVIFGSMLGIVITWTILHTIGSLVIDVVDVSSVVGQVNEQQQQDQTTDAADHSFLYYQEEESNNINETTSLILSNLVSWLCAVGILLSSTLNGFGSVSMPHSCLVGLYLEPIPLETIQKAEHDLQHIKETLESKRAKLAHESYQHHNHADNDGSGVTPNRTLLSSFSPKTSFYTRQRRPTNTAATIAETTVKKKRMSMNNNISFGFGNLDTNDRERKKQQDLLYQEVEFLETLCDELTEEIAELYHGQETASKARTPIGRIRGWLGVVFSIVLLIRLASAMWDIYKTYYYHHGEQDDFSSALSTTISDTSTGSSGGATLKRRGDPITSALLWLMGHNLVSHEDYNTFSQCISLLLTAVLSFSQLRMFLRTVAALNRRVTQALQLCYCTKRRDTHNNIPTASTTPSSASSTASNNIIQEPPSTVSSSSNNSNVNNNFSRVYTHILGSLTGCYFLSCVVVTKRILPPEYRSGFSAALGGTEYCVHSAVVNSAFCLSALMSASILGLLFGIQQQNSKRHATAADLVRNDVAASLGNLDAC